MTYLIRAAFIAISLATITPVANAATAVNGAPPVNGTPVNDTPAPVQQDWSNG
jgi:hypothetical protein